MDNKTQADNLERVQKHLRHAIAEREALRAELIAANRRAEQWRATAEEESWPFEWQVATELKAERDALRAQNAGLLALLELAVRYVDHPDVKAMGFALPAESVAQRIYAAIESGGSRGSSATKNRSS